MSAGKTDLYPAYTTQALGSVCCNSRAQQTSCCNDEMQLPEEQSCLNLLQGSVHVGALVSTVCFDCLQTVNLEQKIPHGLESVDR